ncbi:MAG: hypothetical protein ACK583_09320 [Cyanobacteriota bacterium]
MRPIISALTSPLSTIGHRAENAIPLALWRNSAQLRTQACGFGRQPAPMRLISLNLISLN